MAQTPKLLLELLANSPGNQINANTVFSALDQLVMPRVVDKDLAAPPGSPANGAMYIPAGSPSGAWSGKANNLAWWLTSVGGWTFLAPSQGMSVRVLDEQDGSGLPKVYTYSGSAWVQQSSGGTALPVVQTFTGNKALALTDNATYNISQDGSTQTVTVEPQSSVTWLADSEIHFEQGGVGQIDFAGGSGVTIRKLSGFNASTRGQYGPVTLKRVAEDVWTLFGALKESA